MEWDAPYSGCDAAELTDNLDVKDPDSIIESLENATLEKHLKSLLDFQGAEYFGKLLQTITRNVSPKLRTTLHLFSDAELDECLYYVGRLEHRLHELFKTMLDFQNRRSQKGGHNKVECCGKQIHFFNHISWWQYLQKHQHVEDMLVQVLGGGYEYGSNGSSTIDSIDHTVYSSYRSISFDNYYRLISDCISNYKKELQQLLYPDMPTTAIGIQILGPDRVYCLLCNCEIDGNLEHVFGADHNRKLKRRLVRHVLYLINCIYYMSKWALVPMPHRYFMV